MSEDGTITSASPSQIYRTFSTNIKRVGTQGKIALAALVGVVIFTIFFTVIRAGWNPENIDFASWVTKMAINVALCLVCMFVGETFFISYLTKRPDGVYQENLTWYKTKRTMVENKTNYLGQYLNIQHEKEVVRSRHDYLQDNGIENVNGVLLLDITEVDNLIQPYKKTLDNGKVVKFKPYTKKQIKLIKYVLEGNVVIKRVPKNFFLDANSNAIGRTDYNQAGSINFEKEATRHSRRIIKVITILLISAFWAGLTVDGFMKGDDVQAWFDLISRITACIGGFVTGCFTSGRVNRIECRELVLKGTFLNEFHEFLNKNPNYFTKTDEEWEADSIYEKWEEEQKLWDSEN